MLRRLGQGLLALVIAAAPLRPLAASPDAPVDPYFREALYYAHQGSYFEALERLDAELAQHYGVDEPALDTLYPVRGDAEFSVGDFELRYRMHQRAGRAIEAVLEGDVDEAVRADAGYRLARIHFQKGQPEDALGVLDALPKRLPEDLEDDVAFLRANVLLALERPDEAAAVLRKLQDAETLHGFSAYNLGIALLEQGEVAAAVAQLDRAGRIRARDRESHAIRDKSNLVLGTMLFEAGEFERATRPLERIRLDGPYSNQALLRAGWAEASAEQFERAVVPWSILAERDPTDAAVQEALLALPFAYSKLAVHGRAAVLYQRAASTFGDELGKLDASLASIDSGAFLEALEREELRRDEDWVIRMRQLPDAPETFYLVSLMASHEFQTGLQNYLDLADMRRRLERWQRSLDAFDDLIGLRRAYYEPRLPEVDRSFRRLDAQMRLRLEQRRHLAERLEKMLTAPAPELLATTEEQVARARLTALSERLDAATERPAAAPSHPGSTSGPDLTTSLRRRLARLEGALLWRLETRYHARLTEAHDHLRALDADVAALEARHAAFVRTRQAATHSYRGYAERIEGLRARTGRALARIDGLKQRQGELLERVASRALHTRRGRLTAYQNKARFAFADNYDRAAKARAR